MCVAASQDRDTPDTTKQRKGRDFMVMSSRLDRTVRQRWFVGFFQMGMLIFAVAIFSVSGPCFAGLVIEDDFSTAEEARAFESRIIQLIDDTRGAVVGVEILVRDQRGRMVGVAGGSGAIIDADDGIILTAGHVGRAAKLPVRVYLDDGSMLPAVTLGQHLDGQEDCGLIKIEPEALTKLPEGTF